MAPELNPRQLTGREESHLVALPSGHRLQAQAAAAFQALQDDARSAGFDLAIASSLLVGLVLGWVYKVTAMGLGPLAG